MLLLRRGEGGLGMERYLEKAPCCLYSFSEVP